MVFYYKIRGGQCRNAHSHITLTSEDITCYVGRDKHENEYLIKYGWPGDVWFHVEGLSSAHVYFRLDCFSSPEVNPQVRNLLGKLPIDDLPEESVEDMCQIVKHNSIKGCKMASCKIVYTPHSNLKKTFQMDSGTVTYHDTRLQRHRRCDKDRARIKELESSKSADIAVDYYEEMKANERRIIDLKKKLKTHGATSMDIYDPVLSDLRSAKAKAKRQGDEKSGLDSGLAALEGLALGGGGGGGSSAPSRTPARERGTPSAAAGTSDGDDADAHLPIWQREANDRLDNRNNDERARHFLARGYTPEEIRAATAGADPSAPWSVTLARLWSTDAAADGVVPPGDDLAAAIYEARNEEREVLEAIYGEDDHVRFGWRTDEDDENEDDEDEDEDDPDPSRPFSFDSTIPVPGYEPPARYEYPPPLLLEVCVDHRASHYPFGRTSDGPVEAPVLALVGGGLPADLLRTLTDRLKEAALERSAQSEPGEPQVFDLLQAAGELAEEVVAEETAALEAEAKRERAARAKEERERAKEEAERLGVVDATTTKLTFRSEADRRAYAQSVVAAGLRGGF